MDGEVIDLAYLERFSKGDRGRMAKYIRLYMEGAPALFARLSQSHASGDAEGLALAAHSLRSQVNLMGARPLFSLLTALEQDARSLGTGACTGAVEQALALNEAVMAALRGWLGGQG